MGISNFRFDVTTDAGGAATVFSQGPVQGEIESIRYTPDASNPLATGADIVFSGESSGINVLTQNNIGTSAFTSAPRQPTHSSVDGSASLYAAGGQAVLSKIVLAGERLKLVVAQGGNALSGRFDVTVSKDD